VIHDEYIALAIQDFNYPLDPDRRRTIADHLAICDDCRAEVALLGEAHEGLNSWGSEKAPLPLKPVSTNPMPRVTPTFWPALVAAVAAGILLGAAGGYTVGRSATAVVDQGAGVPTSGSLFTLFLEEPAGTWPPVAGDMRPGYVEWRDSLVARGQFNGGDRFSADGGWYIARGGVAQPAESLVIARDRVNYSGYFVIQARDYAQAVEIAKGSPHLNYGGILVRRSF
jgi:hypothetical protein